MLQVLEDLIAIYQTKEDKEGVMRVEADIDKVTEETDRQMARFREFLSSVSPRAVLT